MSTHATGEAQASPVASPRHVVTLVMVAGGILLSGSVVRELAATWRDDPYYSYAVLVPAFSAYVGWTVRRHLGSPCPRPGLALLASVAAFALLAGLGGQALAVRALGIPIAVMAVVLALYGTHAVGLLMFPIGFLVLLAPPPRGVIEAVSPRLQELAAAVAEHALRLVAIPVDRTNLELQIGADTLEITDACNGLRFLLTMAVVGVALAWAMGRSPRARLAIVGLSLVAGLAANLARVTVTAAATYVVGVVAATGPGHLIYGKAVYALFGGALLATLWLVWGRPRQGLPPGRCASPPRPR